MHTKFNVYSTIEYLEDHWKYIAMVELDLPITAITKRQFHKWMRQNYGEPELRWSIRWTLLGVDIRFSNSKDFFKFTMFHNRSNEYT